jgi:tetratricopeptide (TPR) repeat protein
LHLQNQQYQRAIEACSSALRQATSSLAAPSLEARLWRGLAYYRLGYYQEAFLDFEVLSHQYPQDARVYYNLGLVESVLGQPEQAIAHFDEALTQANLGSPAIDPADLADIYDDRGLAKLAVGNYEAAIEDFDQAIAMDAANQRTYFNRACACHRRGDYARAIQDLAIVLAIEPDHADAYLMRGQLWRQVGRLEQAQHDLEAAAYHFYHQGQSKQYQRVVSLLQDLPSSQSRWV